MNKFTSEPWSIKGPSPGGTPCDDGGDYAILAQLRNGEQYIIAEVISKVGRNIYAPSKANAQLMVIAPKMYEVLEDINKWYLSKSSGKYVDLLKIIEKTRTLLALTKEQE